MDLSPLWVSLKTVALSTAVDFVAGILFAWLTVNSRSRFKSLLDGLLTLPLVLPPTVLGFFLLLFLGRSGLGGLLEPFGISVIFTWPAAVIAAAVAAFPLMYRTVRGAFEQMDGNIPDAARSLGASEWRVFLKVAVPLARPGIVAGTILAFARALGEFGATLMVAGGIPGKTLTVPVAIYFLVENGETEKAMLWVLLVFVISLASIMALNIHAGKSRKPTAYKHW